MSDKAGLWQSLTRIGATGYELWVVKLLCLLVDLFVAFFSFALAMRMYNHVGYLINSSQELGRYSNSPGYVAALLNRGGGYYSLGMRSYYVAVPLVFWLFGPDLMLVATAVLITILYHIDRAPNRTAHLQPQSYAATRSAVAPTRIGGAQADNRQAAHGGGRSQKTDLDTNLG
jgi:uncharacterized membrane protein